jgi:hypothetical protein
LSHLVAIAEEHRVLRLFLQLLSQVRDLAAELPLLQRVGEQHLELGVFERLADEIGGAELHRLHHGVRAPLTRDHDNGYVAIDLLERGERRQPVHAPGHHDVEQHRGRPLGVKSADRLVRIRRCHRGVSARAEERPQEAAHGEVVVNDHHLGFLVHRAAFLPGASAGASYTCCEAPSSKRSATTEKRWNTKGTGNRTEIAGAVRGNALPSGSALLTLRLAGSSRAAVQSQVRTRP